MAKRKALGQGLTALFGEEIRQIEDVNLANEQVEKIALGELRANPYQPRRIFDEQALAELSKSIQQDGVFQPIIVRQSSIKGYEIIAGERRFRASKLAGKKTIPAIIREFTEEQMMQVAVLENLQRENLNPLEEAEAYDMLMNKLGLTQEKVAKRLGKTRSYIANYLRLLGLPTEVKAMVQDNLLEKNKARALLGLKNEAQMVAAARQVVDEGLNTRQVEQLVKEKNEGKLKSTARSSHLSKKKKSFYIRESEDLLTGKFGTKVAIQEKGERGKIEIEYVSQSDLTRILDILGIELDE
ncbi:MAG: ParB/RepB/Spo0J family partition protein [Lactobacillales bacterium]|jgi:ParB family chromosome partitioning protein|nr:ParB/RepB/Spo0J family partition protein [Lactobacillales bacterium]